MRGNVTRDEEDKVEQERGCHERREGDAEGMNDVKCLNGEWETNEEEGKRGRTMGRKKGETRVEKTKEGVREKTKYQDVEG